MVAAAGVTIVPNRHPPLRRGAEWDSGATETGGAKLAVRFGVTTFEWPVAFLRDTRRVEVDATEEDLAPHALSAPRVHESRPDSDVQHAESGEEKAEF